MKKEIRSILIIVITLLVTLSVTARTHTSPPTGSEDFLIENYDLLPFKDQRYNSSWVDYVNSVYGVSWSTPANPRTAKCLSYSASTVNDWFKVMTGQTLGQYQNFINNRTENGTNPRELEAIYHDEPNPFCLLWPTKTYCYANPLFDDSITGEYIPYNVEGYAEILTNPPSDWINQNDPEISSFKHSVLPDEYLDGYKPVGIPTSTNSLKKALEQYGILYLHADIHEYFPLLPLHAMAIIGYDNNDFWVHDSYDGEDSSEFSKYSTLPASDMWVVNAFYNPSWPTENHDFRRTGLTLLKGDLTEDNIDNQVNLAIDDSEGTEQVVKPTIADLDNNGLMESVVLVHKT